MVEQGLRERKKAYTRRTIALAAWGLLQQRGVDATSIRDVAALAEVSEKTVLNYFSTKDELVRAALDIATSPTSMHELAAARPVDEPPVTAVRRAVAAAGAEMDDAQARQVRSLLQAMRDDPQLRASYLRLSDITTRALVEAMMSRARAHGMSRTDLTCAMWACSAVLDAVGQLQPRRVTLRSWLAQIDEQLARVESAWQP